MAIFTDILGLIKQVTGENSLVWGSAQNASMIDLLDEAIAGRVDIDVTTGDVTLTDEEGVTNQARNMILRFTGAPVFPLDCFVPLKQKLYVIDNTTGQPVTVKMSGGIGAVILAGEIVSVVVDPGANQVFKMQLHGNNVTRPAGASATPIVCDIRDQVAGATQVTFYWMQEGSMISLFHLGPVTWTTTTPAPGGLNFDAIVPGSFPAPLLNQSGWVSVLDGASNNVPSAIVISANTLTAIPYPSTHGPYTNGAVMSLPNFQMFLGEPPV